MTKDDESAEIVESAKAVREVAKTTGNAIDATRDLGKFVARFIEGPLEKASRIVENELSYMLWGRQARFMKRTQELLEEVGLSEPTRPIPMTVAIPLFQAASLEEDDDLQDIWATLLVNAANADSGVDVQRMYVSILEKFGHLEVRILQTIYSSPIKRLDGVRTELLPDRIVDQPYRGQPPLPPETVELSLWNLSRLGCIRPDGNLGIRHVYLTTLGERLVDACTLNPHCPDDFVI